MFKKMISIILATTMSFLMSATAFAHTNNHTIFKSIGQEDTNGYTIVNRQIVETFDDGSYILFTESKKNISPFGSQTKSSSITMDFVGASGMIYDTVNVFASFEYTGTSVGFVITNYKHQNFISSSIKFKDFSETKNIDITGKAVYQLKFKRNITQYTMNIKCSKTGAISTSGNKVVNVLEP